MAKDTELSQIQNAVDSNNFFVEFKNLLKNNKGQKAKDKMKFLTEFKYSLLSKKRRPME